MVRPRTEARLAAVQALFQVEQEPRPFEAVIEEFLLFRLGGTGGGGIADGSAPGAHAPLFQAIVRASCRDQATLDAVLATALAEEWPLARLDPVLRAVLRAAAAELSMPDGPPARVVINEYLDVAHAFFTGEEPALVNGVLDRLGRHLRPAEFPPPAGPRR
jgi:N utilization substance protein B